MIPVGQHWHETKSPKFAPWWSRAGNLDRVVNYPLFMDHTIVNYYAGDLDASFKLEKLFSDIGSLGLHMSL